mgnify:CR=1 FL=1
MTVISDTQTRPQIERLRLEPVRRTLTVAKKFNVTPNMIRIVLSGDELSGVQSPGADDNIKMIVPDEIGKSVMRSYTPRAYNAEAQELVIDFAVHEAGPATRWALDVEPGDKAVIAGPRGSKRVMGKIDRWLMIADETALPALARRLEDGKSGEQFDCLITVPSESDQQDIESASDVRIDWLHRDETNAAPCDATPLLFALERMDIMPGTYVWIAAEGGVVRTLRNYLMGSRGVDKHWIKATGYWVNGKADTSAKFEE